MNHTTRPPPKVLLIHNGNPYDAHVKHLTDAGLRVTETHADAALAETSNFNRTSSCSTLDVTAK